jgi:hypothetical protein
LFGFEDERAAAVEVNAAGGGLAVALVERNGALEDVGVVRGVLARGIGRRDLEDAAKLGEEERVVGPLGGADVDSAGDESGDGGFGRGRRGGHAAVRDRNRTRCACKSLSPAAGPDGACPGAAFPPPPRPRTP